MADRIRIRIEDDDKARAMARADGQGLTLSDAVRGLLKLWCDGQIDLQALESLPKLPTSSELQALGVVLDGLSSSIDQARGGIGKFGAQHRRALDLAETYQGDVAGALEVLRHSGYHVF